MKTNCYDNIRKYLQDHDVSVLDATKHSISPSNKRRKILHRFLDDGEDNSPLGNYE